jgi:hypothetical protein
MLLNHPWLRDAKMSHNWAIIISLDKKPVQLEPYMVTKKLGAPTKRLEVLVCYDFHSRICDKKEDLMSVIELRLFSIGTIVVLTSVWLDQPIKLIISTSLNIVEYVIVPIEPMFELLVSFDILVEPISILHVKIAIPPNTFQQHLLEMFFQPEVGEMEIDETLI